MAAIRRTTDNAQPFQPDEDFSQALPENFDAAAFDQEVGTAVEFETASTGAEMLAVARRSGALDRSGSVSVTYTDESGALRIKATFLGGAMVSAALPDAETAHVVEAVYREAAHAISNEMKRRVFTKVHLSPELGTPADAAALAAKLARQA